MEKSSGNSSGSPEITVYISTGLTEGINGMLYWDREDKLTSYSATEGIKRLVIVGQHDECTHLVGTGANWF